MALSSRFRDVEETFLCVRIFQTKPLGQHEHLWLPVGCWDQNVPREGIRKNTDRKKNTNSGKDQVCRRECLSNAHISTDITGSCLGAYQADGSSDGIRKGRQNIDRRVEPFGQALIATLRLIKLLDLSSKNSSNAARRIAFLELCSEWMAQKVLLCPLSIRFQGIVKN